jgi:hypothetical protein
MTHKNIKKIKYKTRKNKYCKNKSKKINNKKTKNKFSLKGGTKKSSPSSPSKYSLKTPIKSPIKTPLKSSVKTILKKPLYTSFEIPKFDRKLDTKLEETFEIEENFNIFFEHLKRSEFPQALCILYKLYTQFPYDKIKSSILSSDFKERYQQTFYIEKQKINQFGILHCDIEARANYIYFIAYIFKKVAEGGSITCEGKELPFLYSTDKTSPSILTILKRFLGYLDTACLITVSYSITSERYNQIKSGYPSSKEESALVEIIDSLYILIPIFPSLQHILDNMTTHNDDGSIAVYSINTTVLSRFIKQSYTDFLQPIIENSDMTDMNDMVSVEEVD